MVEKRDEEIKQELDELGKKLEQERVKYADFIQHNKDKTYLNNKYKTPLDIALEKRESEGGRLAQAFKISSEFFSAILVGIAVGYALDCYVTPSPWGLISFVMLGFFAGILNVTRYAGKKK